MQAINYRHDQGAVLDALKKAGAAGTGLYSVIGTRASVVGVGPRTGAHVLHFAGHGRVAADLSHVALENDTEARGTASWFDPTQMVSWMTRGIAPRLACFMSCSSGNLAAECTRRGVAHVVYTTAPILDKSCVEFVRHFYSELLAGTRVQVAFEEAKEKMTDSVEADKINLGGASPSHDVRCPHPEGLTCVTSMVLCLYPYSGNLCLFLWLDLDY